jgi:glyoxylase-like metal-dependent hydrolase (beta-lactamase superfamily II)
MGEPTIEALYEQVRAAVAPVAGAQPAEPPTVPVAVAPGIRVLALRTPTLPPATHTNVYLVGPDAGPVAVVDPGSPYADQQALLHAALTEVSVACVLLTHHHGDHVGGAQALADALGVPIAAHAATARRLAGRVAVTQLVADGEDVCGALAIHTPGHAEGHLCFAVGGATIAGDMVAGIGTILIDPSEGDMALYFASLERLLARGPSALLPAHGPVIPDGPAKLAEYLAHRRMREARVLDALSDARTTAELVAIVYSDTPKVLWPLAERSLLAHLIKLEREGRAMVGGDGRWVSSRV